MDDVIKKPASELSLSDDFASKLLAGLAESRLTTTASTGKPFLKMQKHDGAWAMGQGDDLVQEGSSWAVNIRSIGHGWSCWTDRKDAKNEKLGQVLVPITESRPVRPDPIQGFPFKDLITFDALCMTGEDRGTEVTYQNGSLGCMKAFDKLRSAIMLRIQEPAGRAYPCPVITLAHEQYPNKTYGGITFNPVWTIVGWADLGGNLEGAAPAPAAAKPAKPAAPAKPKKPPLNAQPEAAAEPAQEAPEPAPATRQRQRPRPGNRAA